MRYTCEIEGFENNWLEIEDRWTKREYKDLQSLPGMEGFDKYFPLKVTGCYIEQVDGEPLTDPKKITFDALDDVDSVVLGFVTRALFDAYQSQMRLGNASARLSSNGYAKIAART